MRAQAVADVNGWLGPLPALAKPNRHRQNTRTTAPKTDGPLALPEVQRASHMMRTQWPR